MLVAITSAGVALAAVPAVPPTPHAFLQQPCDNFGGRLTGSASNLAALNRLADGLRALGYEPQRDTFAMPGWERGDDRVEMIAPLTRKLRVA